MMHTNQSEPSSVGRSVVAVLAAVLASLVPILLVLAAPPPARSSRLIRPQLQVYSQSQLQSDTSSLVAATAVSPWGSPSPVDQSGGGITSVSCPASTFCMAVDGNGDAMTWNGST
ncbi:MAG: hypothetical protein ACYDGY_07590, partial [Acidimicrobiales bacterium]